MADVTLKDARGDHISQSEVADLITDMAAKAAAADLATLSASVIALDGAVSANTTALESKIGTDQLGVSGGVATLDTQGTISLAQIPDGVGGGETIGAVIEWHGIDLPTGDKHLWVDGGAYLRASYPDLFDAITSVRAGDTTNASAVISGMASTTNLEAGYYVEGAGIPAGTTIASVDSGTQITLSATATATASAVDLRFSPWAFGDGSTTFNIGSRKGLFAVGRDNMGGTAANNIGTAASLGGINGTRIGAIGGKVATSWRTLLNAVSGSGIRTLVNFDGASIGSGSDSTQYATNLPKTVVVNYIIRALP